MAVIHRTTLTPTKLELLTPWLPDQPWYRGGGSRPELSRVGGFRLDDPDGEVGIEFMVARDAAEDRPGDYLVPLTYRGAPLAGADRALLGTSEHGVLGRRWIYDGTYDPVLVTQLFAFMLGRVEAQAQSISNQTDPSVTGRFADAVIGTVSGPVEVGHGPEGTDVLVRAGAAGELTLRFHRVLAPAGPGAADAGSALGEVTAEWQGPDGGTCRGLFASVHTAGTA
ncbi:1,4-alpha-glucan branching protein [Streptomyces pactum]|uniref:1,4-alpha-glucan branching protein n=1 Tax=Streptomyces pactum TaxID=68249 RepID=A0ABS0NEI1_9ACTN|nr:1,4-alpha-glucan branching protein [Streptomyces pactum]MBH5333544.1 1,4-alpha-glucan branching protein [Streptomyces pactum]